MTYQSSNNDSPTARSKSRTRKTASILTVTACALALTTFESTGRGQSPPPRLQGDSTHPMRSTSDSLGTTYGGGPVLSDVQIVSVFWGPNVNPTVTSQIGGFFSAYTAASQIGWMCEYNTPTQTIGSGSFAGNFTITPTVNTGTNITDANIQDELAARINAGNLPAPNANTLYVVQFPPGDVITSPSGTSCIDFCAYHSAGTRTINGASTTFPYAVMPDFASGGCTCGDRSVFDNFTKSASHEIAEAISDTQPFSGWSFPSGEIGDVCNFATLGDGAYYNFTSGGTTYAAQLEWSHSKSMCVPGGTCQPCNPFLTTCTTTIPPDVPFNGPLFYAVQSSGCGTGAQGPRSCSNSITLSPGTTIPQKCTALVNAINGQCGSGAANFQADGSKCVSGTFTVTDLSCNGTAPTGNGLSLLLASGQGSLQGSGMLNDYEQDVISNGCQGGGDSLVMLNGTPTGSAINGTQSSVLFVVSTPAQGTVIETVQTNATTTASSIVSQGVAKANLSLTAVQSNVRCAVDPVIPTLAHCTMSRPAVDGGEGSGADAPATGVPVSFQVNDTGLTRTILAGPSKDVGAATQSIRSAGGIPNVLKFNFVGGTACSPCGGGMSGPTCCAPASAPLVPAFGEWAAAALMILLGAVGFVLARSGRARANPAS
jgi:hypothetical protein